MPKFTISHITSYKYDQLVYDSANQIMLYPIEDEWQEIVTQQIKVTGEPLIDVYTDYYGNKVGTFSNPEQHKELNIESTIIVNIKTKNMPKNSMFVAEQWENLKSLALQLPYINFLKQEHFTLKEEILKVVSPMFDLAISPIDTANYLCDYVYNNFQYVKGVTSVETTIDEILRIKSGVCQDFAHILLVMLRYLNIPSRYVSGYICPNKNGMRGEGATHAWVEAYIPDFGWLGFDPTNNCIVNDTHVRLAVGRNFIDCSPVKGTYKGTSAHSLKVKVTVAYEDDPVPKEDFIIEEIVSETPINSYRRFVELQQIQQQQ